jgi:hypothetical protein
VHKLIAILALTLGLIAFAAPASAHAVHASARTSCSLSSGVAPDGTPTITETATTLHPWYQFRLELIQPDGSVQSVNYADGQGNFGSDFSWTFSVSQSGTYQGRVWQTADYTSVPYTLVASCSLTT